MDRKDGSRRKVEGDEIPDHRRLVVVNMTSRVYHHAQKIQYGTAYTICGRVSCHPYIFFGLRDQRIDLIYHVCKQCQGIREDSNG